MIQQKSLSKPVLMPLVLLWLLVHAALLALILGAKFLLTKTVLLTMLALGALAFLFNQFQAKPRKISHTP